MLNTHYDNDEVCDIIREERESEVKEECKRICLPECKDCDKLYPYFEDCTEAFDCGPFRSPKDIRMKPACYDFPDGCEPGKCDRYKGLLVEKLIEDIDRMPDSQTPNRELGNYESIRSRLAEIFNLKKTA